MAKAKTSVADRTFGKLAWDALDGTWVAGVEVDYFRDFGRDLPVLQDEEEEDAGGPEDDGGEGEEADPVLKALSTSTGFIDLLMQTDEVKRDMAKLPPEQRGMFDQMFRSMREKAEAADNPPVDIDQLAAEGKFLLSVVPGGRKKPPTDVQREAWAELKRGGEAVFAKVMDRALEAYRRQRPVRLRWWKAFDPGSPPAHLPDAKTVKALSKIVRPAQFRVYPGGEIGIHFDAAWDRGDGFGVLLRAGEIIGPGPDEVALEYRGKKNNGKRLDHPAFGPLRLEAGDEWVGELRFEPFREFFRVADARRSWKSPGLALLPWSPPWDFIEGEFGLTVYTEDGGEPSQAQADVFLAFKAGGQKVADDVLAAVFKYYRKCYAPHAGADDDEPRVATPDDLREKMKFQSASVHGPGKRKAAAVVLDFSCSFDEEHGLSVLWRNGKVEQVDQMAQVDV